MNIDVRKKGNINILYMSGRMTIGKGDVTLREKLAELLNAGERFFLFNMTEVPYLDSAGVGETVACHKRVRERNGVIKLVLPSKGRTYQIFIVASLDRVFEIFADEQAALASFQA